MPLEEASAHAPREKGAKTAVVLVDAHRPYVLVKAHKMPLNEERRDFFERRGTRLPLEARQVITVDPYGARRTVRHLPAEHKRRDHVREGVNTCFPEGFGAVRIAGNA